MNAPLLKKIILGALVRAGHTDSQAENLLSQYAQALRAADATRKRDRERDRERARAKNPDRDDPMHGNVPEIIA